MVTVRINATGLAEELRSCFAGAVNAARLGVAEWLRSIITKSFEAQASPEGVPWPPLSEPYATLKATGQVAGGPGPRKRGAVSTVAFKRILELNGELFRDATNSVTIVGNTVTAESILPYAAAHQYGAEIEIPKIVPKSAGVLRWYSPTMAPIFAMHARAHTVTIPARPYLPSPEFAEREGAKVVEGVIQEAINQAGLGPQGK
jgi:phage gpG-like protein